MIQMHEHSLLNDLKRKIEIVVRDQKGKWGVYASVDETDPLTQEMILESLEVEQN